MALIIHTKIQNERGTTYLLEFHRDRDDWPLYGIVYKDGDIVKTISPGEGSTRQQIEELAIEYVNGRLPDESSRQTNRSGRKPR